MILLNLKIDPDLLDPNFNGYKLSLDSIGVHKIKLSTVIDEVFPSEDQFSFLHLKLFTLHNYLYSNQFSHDEYGKVYFIDDKWKVYENYVNPNSLSLEGVNQVWEIPANETREPGHWNVCMKFSSENICVFSDGAGTLHVVNTSTNPWTVEYSSEVLGKGKIFSILDTRFTNDILNVCLLSITEDEVEPVDENKTDNVISSKLKNIINWICLHKTQNGWCLKRQRQIIVPGTINYFNINSYGTAIYMITDKSYTFTLDSEKQIVKPDTKLKNDVNKAPDYIWRQSDTEVTIIFKLNEDVLKTDINISITDSNIRVTCKNEDLLNGNMCQLIDSNLTTWKVEDNTLEIVLQKQSEKITWTELVVGDTRGEQEIDPNVVQEVHEKLAHLCSDTEVKPNDSGTLFNMQQLEECDVSSNDNILYRIDGELHCTTHQMNLCGHQWLFNTYVYPDECEMMCLRHDVDGCLLQIHENESGEVSIKHEGTLNAFGYVQASKSQKKFSTCSADKSYAIICESSRHVFIYFQSSDINSELRYRPTGRRIQAVSKQNIVTLNNEEIIMGVHTGNHCLYILTNQNLYMAKVKS